MSARVPIAIIAGAACAFLLPLPQQTPPSPSRAVAAAREAPAPGAVSIVTPQGDVDPPLDPDSIARMDRTACMAALDRLLRRYAASPPSPEQQQLATALVVRIFRSAAAKNSSDFPGSWRLPAWLLATSWMALAKESPGVPDALRRALRIMPAGLDAAQRIAESLAVSGMDAAGTFVQSMPADWRKALRDSCLLGLAAVHPLEAARQLWKDGGRLRELGMTAARHGPIGEVVQLLVEYGEDIGDEAALLLLHARDPAGLRKLVEDQADEGLAERLAWLTAHPDPPQSAGRPLSEMLAAAVQHLDTGIDGAVSALQQSALQDPAGAINAWAALEDGRLKDRIGEGLLRSLAMHHPAEALAWSEEHSPRSSGDAVRDWLSFDAPAALRAILELPYSSVFRQKAVEELKGQGRLRILSGWNLQREDLLSAAQELPPELLRQIMPE